MPPIAACFVAGLTAFTCSALGCTDLEDPDDDLRGGSDVCKLLEPSTPPSCADQRRIAKIGNEGCSSLPNAAWKASRLANYGPLSTYCVYERVLEDDANDPPPSHAVGDCRASPASLEDEVAAMWLLPFQRAAGRVDVDLDSLPIDWNPVQIAVIDTAPPVTSNGRAIHGQAMAGLARELAQGCLAATPGACKRRVASFLGLPRTLESSGRLSAPDPVHGGTMGYASDVAVALDQVLEQWAKNPAERLIINLSLSWLAPGAEIASPPVYEMLERASCRGALIIAASGNHSPRSCEPRSFEPARWETHARPNAARCAKLGEPYAGGEYKGYSPLVHSITPVDKDLEPLITNQPASASRLAAIGFQAVTKDTYGNPLGPLSGSSVSTAVVSGIAALIWSTNSDRGADDVMDLVWQAGTPRELGVVSTYYDTGLGVPMQRVTSACSALAIVCPACGVDCPPTKPEPGPALAELPITDSWAAAKSDAYECQTCEAKGSTIMSPVGTVPTPGDPFAGPQPGEPPCPPCWIDEVLGEGQPLPSPTPSATVNLHLSSAYATFQVTGFMITLTDATGAMERHYYPNDPALLGADELDQLRDPGLYDVGGQAPMRAWIDIYFRDGERSFSAGNELPILRP